MPWLHTQQALRKMAAMDADGAAAPDAFGDAAPASDTVMQLVFPQRPEPLYTVGWEYVPGENPVTGGAFIPSMQELIGASPLQAVRRSVLCSALTPTS